MAETGLPTVSKQLPAAGPAEPSDADARAISEELLGAFMALMPDAAVAVDATGRVVSVNEQAEALFGYPPGSLAGLPIETLVPERARNRHRQHRTAYVASPENRPMGAGLELTGRRRDGREFPVDISLAPITSSTERLVVAAVRDITDKKAATAAQAELAAIVRSSLDAIMSTTLEGQITSWNPAAERLFGHAGDEIVGRHVAELVPPESSAVFEELLELAVDGAHRGARDTRWLRQNGEEVDVAVSISPLRDKSGTLLGFSSVVRDISERKQAENELRRLLAEEERLERQHAATAEIRLALLSGTPLVESVTLIGERTAELLDAPVAVISVHHNDDLRIMSGTGPAAALVGELLPAKGSFAAQVLESGRLAQTPRRTSALNATDSPPMPDGPVLGVPILIGGTATGLLTVVRELGAAEYSPSDLVLAEALAAQAALAFELERARQDREQMMLVGDRERIARDLHDHVIQQLFATGMALQSTLPLIDRPGASTRVTDAIDSLDETIREIRNTIYNLSVPTSGNRQLRTRVLRARRVGGRESRLRAVGSFRRSRRRRGSRCARRSRARRRARSALEHCASRSGGRRGGPRRHRRRHAHGHRRRRRHRSCRSSPIKWPGESRRAGPSSRRALLDIATWSRRDTARLGRTAGGLTNRPASRYGHLSDRQGRSRR